MAVGIDDLRASVRALLKGLEAEVTLVVDVMLPNARLIDAVQAFEATFPTVTLRLHVEALSAVAQLVRRDGAMIGIGGGLLDVEPELELIHVGDVEMIPVAVANHPLARGRPNASGAARNHRQLVLTVRTPFSEGPDLGIFSADVWRLADLGAKHALLLPASAGATCQNPMCARIWQLGGSCASSYRRPGTRYIRSVSCIAPTSRQVLQQHGARRLVFAGSEKPIAPPARTRVRGSKFTISSQYG